MQEIFEGQFFWGIVVGLLLSFVGGWVQAKLTVAIAQKQQKKVVVKFCIDTIKNINNIVSEMDATRDRTRAIYLEFLTLIDSEINVYDRNREFLIHLPEPLRNEVRTFMNSCAVKKADISSRLLDCYELLKKIKLAQEEGRNSDAQQYEQASIEPLQDAHRAADKLYEIVKDTSNLLTDLNRL